MSADCADCQPTPGADPAPAAAPAPPAHVDALLDVASFEPPALGGTDGEAPRLIIEFCDRCRWLHRATWTQTELFLTFPPSSEPEGEQPQSDRAPSPGLKAIQLVPRNRPETGGRFRVWLLLDRRASNPPGPYEPANGSKERWRGWELVWDRKVEARFPEMKELKQRIRNLIAPAQDLGHSDKPVASSSSSSATAHAHSATPAPPASALTTPAHTAAEMQRPPASEPVAAGGGADPAAQVDLSALPDQPLQPLTAADFEPRFRCA
ncbi:hypothetical protein JCM8202_004866 [Rhodotorula sphaerocarpa]